MMGIRWIKAEIPKPPIPEEIRPRVKCYFGAKVEG